MHDRDDHSPSLDTETSRPFWGSCQDVFQKYVSKDLTPRVVTGLFFLAFAIGMGLKLWFGLWITIGYEDYHLTHAPKTLNLNALQKNFIEQGGSLAYELKDTSGPSCPDSQ